MRRLSEKAMRRIIWILFALAIYFLGSAFYIPAKAMLAQHLLQAAWQESVANKQINKPWPWADTWPVARLRVPAYQVDQIVLNGDRGNSLAFAPGLHPDSDLNMADGMVVISAHRDTHFRFLKKLSLGEVIELETVDAGTVRYRVEDIQVVDISHSWISAPGSNRWLGLVTCYPFNTITANTLLRYVVIAEEVKECPANKLDCFV